MVLLSELEFAQKFPFSETGKRVIKELGVPVDGASEETKKRALARVRAAFERKVYFQLNLEGHREMLETEILSYPLAKIYLSVINNAKLFGSFAKSNADAVFALLEGERGESLKLRLAQEFNLEFDLAGNKFYSVAVVDFLSAETGSDVLKLVNQRVEKGRVFLNEERFSRFLSGRVFTEIVRSLPVSIEGIPESIKREALFLGDEFTQKQRAKFKSISGKLRVELFPPCMEKLYADLLQGKNLSHLARFDLTTFLNAVGMPEDGIIKAFGNAPNYKERVTRYQVKKILRGGRMGKGYSPASCAKMRSHALCIAQCNVKHPAQFYRRELSRAKQGGKEKVAS